MFAKDVADCFSHGSVEAVDQGVYFGVLIVKDGEWSKLSSYHCSEVFSFVGVLEFLKTELDSYVALLFHPLEAKSECHHHKLMVASDASSWKAPGLCAVNTCFDHDVVEPIVVFSSWAVPCPASTWFVWTRCVHLLQVVVTGEFYEPRASFVGLRVAVLVTYPLPVLACILSSLCIPVAPNYNNVFFFFFFFLFASGLRVPAVDHRS